MKLIVYSIAAALVLMAVSITRIEGRSRSQESPGRSKIDVSDATYGLNCRNDQAGNATQYVKSACDGKDGCSFPVRKAAGNIGDNCPGHPKDFDVTYVCGDKEKKAHEDGESNGKTVFLTCQAPSGPPKIEVSDATYGLNCRNDQAGNATQYVKSACDGKDGCSFPVRKAAGNIGDNCPGHPKDFDVTYVCGDKKKRRTKTGSRTERPCF